MITTETTTSDKIPTIQPCDLTREHLLRVNVVGVSGTGKSWLATRLSEAMNSRYVNLDDLYWEPNWREAETSVFQQRVVDAISCEQWVADGNYYTKTRAIRWPDATLIIWVDNSFARTFWRATRRAIRRIRTKEELWRGTGNRETFRRTFLSRESILLWTITSFRRLRRRYRNMIAESEVPVLRLTGPGDLNAFFRAVESAADQ